VLPRSSVQVLWWDNSKSKSNQAAGDGIPSLIYVSREKRTTQHHHFKAGAMNVLVRAVIGVYLVPSHGSPASSKNYRKFRLSRGVPHIAMCGNAMHGIIIIRIS
jgi:hypothetical protein